LARANSLLRGLAEPHFASYGLSMAQWGVLRTLLRLEQRGLHAPRLRELGAEMVVRPPSLSATVERMSRAGLVARREDPKDKRAKLIMLASKGRRLLEVKVADHRKWAENVMSGLDRAEQEALSHLLVKASGHMHSATAGSQHRAAAAQHNGDDDTESDS
jgi:DNA-binding MarR family transcriptional regulator